MRQVKPILGIVILLLHQLVSGQVISAIQPIPGQLVGDSLSIRVAVRSTTLLGSVTGVITDSRNRAIHLQTALLYDPRSATWSGSLVLAGIPNDSLTLSILPGNVPGPSQVQFGILHDSLLKTRPGQGPQLSISLPLPYSTARPVIHFSATAHSTTDSCQLILRATAQSTTVIGTFLDSIQTDLDLSPYEGSGIVLSVQAIDKNKYTTTSVPIPVFVESSPYLQEYFAAPARILNFNYNKLLVADDGPVSNPRIIDLTDSSTVTIPYPGYVDTGYLTPQGAVFSTFQGNGAIPDSLFDFNKGVLYPLGPFDRAAVKVAGNYLLWARPYGGGNPTSADSLYLENLATRTTTLVAYKVSLSALGGRNNVDDVAPNGTVVFVDSTQNIVKYANGSYSAVNQPPVRLGQGVAYPLTDGYNIVYQNRNETIIQAILVGPLGTKPLTGGLRGSAPFPYSDYQVNNKNVAYVDVPIVGIPPDSPLHREVRLMDSTGISSLVFRDAFTNQDVLEWLSPNEQLMFIHIPFSSTSARNWATANGLVKPISSTLGRSYYYDSAWYIAIGRTLFRVHLNAPPDRIKNSTLLIPEGLKHQLTTTDFTANFSGPGQLIGIKITGLPGKGVLAKAGIPVHLNDPIVRADLGLLSYTPDSAFIGSDTLQWNAFDGITYTPADARLSLRMIGKPLQPQLEGLKTGYCTNASLQTVTVTNFPENGDGTTIRIKLDSTWNGPAGADTTYSFDPAGLETGDHTLIIVFSNVAGASTDTLDFRVQPEATPSVSLSANTTTVSDPAEALTLTATNLAGGGPTPLFTFSKDRDFTNILQNESNDNKWVPDARTLTFGDNPFYVRMRTSDTCYTIPTSVDSIDIRREATKGIVDAEIPGHIIGAAPNPFTGQFTVDGFSNTRRYSLTLYRVSGDAVITVPVINQSLVTLQLPQEAPGLYFLRIVDVTGGRVLGTLRLLKE